MVCGSSESIRPSRFFQSLGFTPAARTAIRTCPGPGCGSGRSTISRTSGPPNRLNQAAFTSCSVLDPEVDRAGGVDRRPAHCRNHEPAALSDRFWLVARAEQPCHERSLASRAMTERGGPPRSPIGAWHSQTMDVLVMGATGNVGGALVELLRARNVRVHAITRQARTWPDGVQGVVGDANDPASLAGAAAGMDGAFLMSGYAAEAQLLSDLGAGHAALLSSSSVPLADSGNAMAAYHRDSEEAVKASGALWTIV